MQKILSDLGVDWMYRPTSPQAIARQLSRVSKQWQSVIHSNSLHRRYLFLVESGNEANWRMPIPDDRICLLVRHLQLSSGNFTAYRQLKSVQLLDRCNKATRLDVSNVENLLSDGPLKPVEVDSPFLYAMINTPGLGASLCHVYLALFIEAHAVPVALHALGNLSNAKEMGIRIQCQPHTRPDPVPPLSMATISSLFKLELLCLDFQVYVRYSVLRHIMQYWDTPRLRAVRFRGSDTQLEGIGPDDTRPLEEVDLDITSGIQMVIYAIPYTKATRLVTHTRSIFSLLRYQFTESLDTLVFIGRELNRSKGLFYSRMDEPHLVKSLCDFIDYRPTEDKECGQFLKMVAIGDLPWTFYLLLFVWGFVVDHPTRPLKIVFKEFALLDLRTLTIDNGHVDWYEALRKCIADHPDWRNVSVHGQGDEYIGRMIID